MSSGIKPKDKHSHRRAPRGFRFKQFSIQDDRCAHKVGTDGTLLGAWVNVSSVQQVLDIGTGSGLIALMLAQRTEETTCINGIELSLPDYQQAIENIHQSPWPRKVELQHTSLQDFKTEKRFDCIVSNPPFFNNSFKPPVQSRVTPRHTDTLPYKDLLIHTKQLLSTTGKFHVILPNVEGLHFIELAKKHAFFLHRQWSFRTRKEKPIERWLMEFGQSPDAIETGEILLYEKEDNWSASYIDLTKGFYLKL